MESLTPVMYQHTSTLLQDGGVLVAGGTVARSVISDAGTGAFTVAGGTAARRSFHTARLLPSGYVVVIGGTYDRQTVASAELYKP